ncbi:MAG: 2Fe-2S iron-sulfur cluster binding domain-containing protein [Pseudomonadota bacterium]
MFKKLFGKRPDARVELVPGGQDFTVGRNQTVLESALAAGIAYPHDCTVGTCGSCRSRLVSGKVDAITPFGYTLSREELEGGYILACQAVPESDLVLEVDIPVGDAAPRRCAARLLETRDLTHDIKQVTWETDAPVSYRAGQYMNITWPGAPAARSYSFSAAPAEGGQTRLTTFIRKVPGGAFTEQLFGGGLADVPFEIEAPHGSFWLRDGEGPILLIGGGSGLAPLMSLLEDAAARGVRRDAILLFGGRAARDLYCADEIASLAARWQGRFEYRPVLSDEPAPELRSGLVTAEIPAALADLGGLPGLQAYLCGPPGMIDAALAALSAAGVPLSAIHYDKFTDASTMAR